MVGVAERRADLRPDGPVHTFCSRLATWNVPMLSKKLAGHRAVETTMLSLHVSAAALREGEIAERNCSGAE